MLEEKDRSDDREPKVDPGVAWEVEEEDLEVAAKAGREPRHAKRYRLRIDREYFVVATGPPHQNRDVQSTGKV